MKAVQASTGDTQRALMLQLYSLLVSLGRPDQAVSCLRDAAQFIAEPLARSLALLLCGDTEQASSDLTELGGKLGQEVDQTCLASIMNASVPGAKHLAHKALLATALQKAGKAHLAPKSWLVKSEDDVKAVFAEPIHTAGYFVKNPAVNRGQGVTVVHDLEQALAVPGLIIAHEAWVIQQAVDPPMLIQERKFGLRVHAMVVLIEGMPKVYLFRESILTLCGAKYDAAKEEPLVHVACTSVQRHLEGYIREDVKGSGSVMWSEQYEECWPSIREAVAGAVKAVWGEDGVYTAGSEGVSMQVFGFDVMIDVNGHAVVLEANMAPQLGDPQAMDELKARIGLPMINSIPYVLKHAIQSVEFSSDLIECDGAPMPWSCWEPVSMVNGDAPAPEPAAAEAAAVEEPVEEPVEEEPEHPMEKID